MKPDKAPQSDNKEPQPLSFDFERAQFERDREEAARRLGVIDPEILTRVDGVWHKHGIPVDENDSFEDDAQYRFGRKSQ